MSSSRGKMNCIYWKKGTCFKGRKCPYYHSEKKEERIVDYKYKKTYDYNNEMGRKSRSPGRRSGSPRRYSPRRYSRSRTRSPRRFSPRRYSRSRSPRRYSPKRYSGSPRRYSRSPRRHGRSPMRYNLSLGRVYNPEHYKEGPRSGEIRSSWMQGNSPMPPPDNITSPVISKTSDCLDYDPIPSGELNIYQDIEFETEQNSPLSINGNKPSDVGYENQLTIINSGMDSPTNTKLSGEYPEITTRGDSAADEDLYSDFSPSRALDVIKNLPKDFFNYPPFKDSEEIHPPTTTIAEVADKKTFPPPKESYNFMPPVAKSENMLPPVTRHDDDSFRAGLPLSHKLFPLINDPAPSRDQLWTPAMDRNKVKNFDQPMVSTWEVNTPYIARNPSSAPIKLPIVEFGKEKEKNSSDAKRKLSESRRKKKRKRKSSTSSSSDTDGSSHKNSSTDENLLHKKKSILTKVWSLMEQKKKLDGQRGDIIMNNKSDSKNLPSILQENAFLSKEIDKQIFVMNKMIQSINEKLGVSVMDNHQQEFYLRSNLLRDDKNDTGTNSLAAPKFPVVDQSEQLSYANKFLKPNDSRKQDDVKKTKKYEDKSQKKAKEKIREEVPLKKIKKEHNKDRMKEESRKESTKDKSWQDVYKEAANKPKPHDGSIKERNKKKISTNEEYAPSADMKPHVKYIDQGMHWCTICTEFCDSVNDFVKHLQSNDHINKLTTDKKKWLPKYTHIVKDKAQKGAPVLTIPLQGVEFMHSLTGFYCSMCDLLIKTPEEASEHAETKIHVSKYKDYLSKNPMYETTYIKDKMAAFAKYSVEKEKLKTKDTFFSKRGETSPPLPKKGQVAKKQVLKPMLPSVMKNPKVGNPVKKDPAIKSMLSEVEIPLPSTVPIINEDEVPKVQSLEEPKFSSIRVASRTSNPVEDKSKCKIADKPEIIADPSDIMDKSIKDTTHTIVKNIEDKSKLNTLRKKVGLPEGDSTSTKKLGIKNFSNIMIGKMPFLKRNKREMVITQDKPDLVKCDSEPNKKCSSILPQVIPKNVEYITEIESFGTKTKFTKVIGPTLPDKSEINEEDDSDMEVDSNDSTPVENNESISLMGSADSSSSHAVTLPTAEFTEQSYYQPTQFQDYSVPPPCLPYMHVPQPSQYINMDPCMMQSYNNPAMMAYNTDVMMQTYSVNQYKQFDSSGVHTTGDNLGSHTAEFNEPPPPGTEIVTPSLSQHSISPAITTPCENSTTSIAIPSERKENAVETPVTYDDSGPPGDNKTSVIDSSSPENSDHLKIEQPTSNSNEIDSSVEDNLGKDITNLEITNVKEDRLEQILDSTSNINDSSLNDFKENTKEDLMESEITSSNDIAGSIIIEPDIANTNVIKNDSTELNSASSGELTLKEAIVQEQSESLSLEQETSHTPAFTALSQELLKLEPVIDSSNIIDIPTDKAVTENKNSTVDASSMEGNDQDDQILEGLQLLVGAESSDESNE